jgi:hypothetical protein
MAKDKWGQASKKAKSMGFDLNETAKKRNAAKKGSDEWAKNQNKITEAFGISTRHSGDGSGMAKVKKKIGIIQKASVQVEADYNAKAYADKLDKKLGNKRKYAGD